MYSKCAYVLAWVRITKFAFFTSIFDHFNGRVPARIYKYDIVRTYLTCIIRVNSLKNFEN